MALSLDIPDCWHHHDASTLAVDEAPGNSILALSECVHLHSADNIWESWWTDFSEYAHLEVPSDWGENWGAGNGSFAVRNDETGLKWGPNALRQTQGTGWYSCSWNKGTASVDVDVVARVKPLENLDAVGGLGARISGTDSSEAGYGFLINCSQDEIRAYEAKNVSHGDVTYDFDPDSWYWVRVRSFGNNHKVKAWKDGDTEPSTWNVEYTDSTHTSPGYGGIWNYYGNIVIDYFAVAYGGIPARLPLYVHNCYHTVSSDHLDQVAYYKTYMDSATRGSWTEQGDPAFGDWAWASGSWQTFTSNSIGMWNMREGCMRWDDVPASRDVEILCKWRCADANEFYPMVFHFRGYNNYGCVIEASTLDNIRLVKNMSGQYQNGGTNLTSPVSLPFAIASNTDYWLKIRAWGNDLKAKCWQVGQSEPAWQIEVTDTTHTNQGTIGYGTFSITTDLTSLDFLSVATGAVEAQYAVDPESCTHDLSDDFDYVATNFVFDFSGYAHLETPSDWTEIFDAAAGWIEARTDISDVRYGNGRILRVVEQMDDAYAVYPNEIAVCQDMDLIARTKYVSSEGFAGASVGARCSGTEGGSNENGYLTLLNAAQDKFRTGKLVNSAWTQLDEGAYDIDQGGWYWVRIQIRGDALKCKIWLDHEEESAVSWHYETTDSSVTAAGRPALCSWSETGDFDCLFVGTGNRDASPLPYLMIQDCYHEHIAHNVDRIGTLWHDGRSSLGATWTEYWNAASQLVGFDAAINDPKWGDAALYDWLINGSLACSWYWQDVGQVRNVEFLTRTQIRDQSGDHMCRLYARMTATNAYYTELDENNNFLRICKGRDTNRVVLGSHAHTITIATWYWVRFRVNGTSLQAKIWNDGAAEPATWDIDVSDTDIYEAGYPAVGQEAPEGNSYIYYDFITLGLGGESAPNLLNPAADDYHDYCEHTAPNLTITESVGTWLEMTDGGAQHVHTAGNVIIDPAWVHPADCSHAHTAPNLPATQVYPADCTHVHTVENIYIGIVYPEDCSHAHSATGDLVLVQTGVVVLVMQDSSHVTTSDHVVIDPAWVYPNDASHVVTGIDPLWWVNDSSHASTSTTPTLTVGVAPHDSSHNVWSSHIKIIWPEILQPNDSFLQPWSPEIYVQTDAVTLNWGHDTGTVTENEGSGPRCNAAFGMSPNLSGKILYITAIWIFEWVGGSPDPTGARLAIYQGDMGESAPNPASPEGYELILDLGQISPAGVAGYTEKTCTKTFVRKNAPTWLAIKCSLDDNWRNGWDYGSPGPGDFSQGMWWSTNGPSQDKVVLWPDPWPSEDGSLNDNVWLCIYAEFSVESAVQLIVQPAFHEHSATDFAVKEMLSLDYCVHLHTAANVIIDPAWANTQDCVHLHQVIDNTIWWVDSCSHVLADDGPLKFPLPVAGATHVLTSPEVALTVHLVVAASSHVTTATTFALTQEHTLSPENSVHGFTDGGPITLAEWELLRVNDSSHVLTGQVDVTQLHILGLDDCIHIHAPPNVAITQTHILANLNSSHACVTSDPSLTQDHSLIVASAASLSLVDAIALVIPLLVSDCSHITPTGAVALTQEHTLAIAGDTLAHTASNVAMIVPITLEDCAHVVTSDTDILLTALHILAVVGITHAHVVTGLLTLFQLHFLAVAGTGRNTDYNEFIVTSDEIDFGYLSADLGGATLTICKWVNR